jgi:hypothetical protein
MRILIATVAALSLGACAAQPRGPTIASVAAQVFGAFGAFGAVDQNCAVSTSPEQNRVAQSKCFDAKQTVQTAEAPTKQRVSAHPLVERSPAPSPSGPREPATIASGVPTLNAEASCHPAENLAVDENVDLCLLVEGKARAQLAQRWTEFPSSDRSHCVRYSSASGGGTYTDLLTCLESERDVRNLNKNRSVARQ